MESKKNNDYCLECREYVDYEIKEVERVKIIKGKEYKYSTLAANCNSCGDEMSIPGLIDKDQELFDIHYRKVEGLITKEDIEKIMTKYNIGKAPLSLALGFGEITLTRYLEGQMPSKKYSDILYEALNSVEFMDKLINDNKEKIGSFAYLKAKEAIESEKKDIASTSKIDLIINYILSKDIEITPLALQKLLYFIQGFSCAINKRKMFDSYCEAWAHGPVFPEVYRRYKEYGYHTIDAIRDLSNKELKSLDIKDIYIIDLVLETFGMYSGKILEAITHKEQPWFNACGGNTLIDYCKNEISIESISKYFEKVSKQYCLTDSYDVQKYINDVLRMGDLAVRMN